MQLCLFTKAEKLLPQLMGAYQVHFLWKLMFTKGLLWLHFGNICLNMQTICFVWRIIKRGYRQVWEMKKYSGRKGSEGECQQNERYTVVNWEKKVMSQKWILMVSVISRLVVILFSAQNVRSGFNAVVLICLGRCVYHHIGMSLSINMALS